MYSPELEELIEAALMDGVITDKERRVLYKRAESMGIDLDEFDMILDARIVKMQKQQQAENAQKQSAAQQVPPVPTAQQAPRSQKYGDVRKCPNCGCVLGAMVTVCPECGHEFTNIQAVSSAVRFGEAIQKAIEEDQSPSMLKKYESMWFDGDTRVQTVIKTFPVPNTKEDLFEFIAILEPKANVGFFSDDDPEDTSAYRQKYEECLNKVRALFPNDPIFAPFLQKKKKRFGLF